MLTFLPEGGYHNVLKKWAWDDSYREQEQMRMGWDVIVKMAEEVVEYFEGESAGAIAWFKFTIGMHA